jgi:hypothetical protein
VENANIRELPVFWMVLEKCRATVGNYQMFEKRGRRKQENHFFFCGTNKLAREP